MREQVCIVLNEREQSKAHAAEAVAHVLGERNITASRIPVNEALVSALKKRAPTVLVIDYLLGDLTTGLDVVTDLKRSGAAPEHVIMYTDEPSMRVAVDAMKLGARDYIPLESASSLSAVVRAVEDALAAAPKEPLPRCHPALRLEDLVAHSPASRRLVDQARAIVADSPPLTVLKGPPGSGVSTLARAIAGERLPYGEWSVVDLRHEMRPLSSLIYPGDGSNRPLLAPSRSLIVLSAELDNGELLPLVERARGALWGSRPSKPANEFLIIGTHDNETANRWSKFHNATTLVVPDLNARRDDIPGLVHAWIREYELLSKEKRKSPSSEALQRIAALEWKGGIRQFRNGIFYALSVTHKGTLSLDDALLEYQSQLVAFDDEIRDSPLTKSKVAWALQRVNGSVRCASVLLGSTPDQIAQFLHVEKGGQ